MLLAVVLVLFFTCMDPYHFKDDFDNDPEGMNTVEKIKNRSFEDYFYGWSVTQYYSDYTTAVIDNTVTSNGKQSLKLTATNGSSIYVTQNIKIKKNTNYNISFGSKTQIPSNYYSYNYLSVSVSSCDYDKEITGSNTTVTINNTSNWQTSNISFNSNESECVNVRIYVVYSDYNTTSETIAWLDDFQLTKN